MKLLFDHNLPPSLVVRMRDLYPESAHVFELGLGEAEDLEIWTYAREEGFAIVSKDSDFHQLSVLQGPPPKVIRGRLGNCSVNDVERELRDRHRVIVAFDAASEAFLVIGRPL